MARGMNKKISAASARAHTRRGKQSSSSKIPSGIFTATLAVLIVGISAWAYHAIQPPPPKTCGSPGGPSVTAPRMKLRDGRHLAYKEHGVLKETAKYRIVFVHGFDSCRHDSFLALHLSPEIIEGLGIYTVSFDRPGYGESDPNPKQSLKSAALDIEDLADQLGLGSKFYVISFSMGGNSVWSSLKYIPHRLAGATLVAPVVNYWWPGFPANLSKEGYYQQLPQDLWAVRVAHYMPWLTYWWNTQKWFPNSAVAARSIDVLSRQDIELLPKQSERKNYMFSRNNFEIILLRVATSGTGKQQGEYETLHRDMIVGFGSWEFDPMDLENPFPNNEGYVHLWHGDEDGLVPVILQRYIAQRLPWIHYHELPGAGHMFPHADGMADTIVKALLFGDKQPPL